ncbi:MAG: glycosyltransferase family 87 protein [Candidatus Omnitrophota bacterium]
MDRKPLDCADSVGSRDGMLIFPRWAASVSILLLTALTIVLLTQTLHKANRPQGNDFTNYLIAANHIYQGEDPYEIGSDRPFFVCPYPMFLPFVMMPFLFLPLPYSCAMWFAANLFAFFFTLRLLSKMQFPDLDNSRLLTLTAAITMILFHIVQNALLNGQVNFWVLLLCVLFLRYYLAGKDAAAGFFLGAAAAIKLFPLLFLALPFIRRRRGAAVYGAGFFLLFCLSPILMLDGRLFTAYASYASDFLLSPASSGASSPFLFSYSLPYLLSRVPFGGAAAYMIAWLLAAFLLVSTLRSASQKKEADFALFSNFFLLFLFVDPLPEAHHLVFLLPALFMAAEKIVFESPRRRSEIVLLIFVFLAYLAGAAFRSGIVLFGALLALFILTARIFLLDGEKIKSA